MESPEFNPEHEFRAPQESKQDSVREQIEAEADRLELLLELREQLEAMPVQGGN